MMDTVKEVFKGKDDRNMAENLENKAAETEEIKAAETPETGKKKLDSHGHMYVKHDLYNHEGLTQDGIAEAFIEFAKKEGLSFFR